MVVLLHGYVGDGATTWRHQIDAFSDEFTIVAWDAPGAGGLSDPPESFGMARYADCLAGFVSQLDLGRPAIVGLSFGGALAIEFGRRHPAVPQALVLVSAYAGWSGSLAAEVADNVRDRFGASMLTFHPTGFRAMARASAEDLRDALPHLRAPTLLVYGDQDVRAPLDVARRLHSGIPQSELVVLPGVGHVGNVEAVPEFNTLLRDFLRNNVN